MNRFKRLYLPIILGIIAAAAVITALVLFTSGAPSSEQAVASYLKACMLQDVDGMVKFASDYAKATLNGGSLTDDGTLKQKLHSVYDANKSVYIGSEIKFSLLENENVESGSDEYKEFAETYGERADSGRIEALSRVKMNVYVDGKLQQKSECYCVQINGRWYFAYQF